MSMVLRPMRRGDVDAVAAMEEILFGAEAWSPELLTTEMTADPASRYYLVADDDGVITGYGGLLAQRGGQADVLTLAVAAHRWGEGIGGDDVESAESVGGDAEGAAEHAGGDQPHP